jgi:death-on-curing protein
VNDPVFLSLEEVYRIHERSLAEHGGMDGARDPGLVESAVNSAQNTFFYAKGDLYDVAASYAYHLAEAQAFIDGNKRTAVGAALIFLARNGAYIRYPTWEFYLAMMAIAEKKLTKAELAALLRKAAS